MAGAAQYEVSVEEPGQPLELRLAPHPQGTCVRSSSSDDPAWQAVVGKLVSAVAGASGPAVELLGKDSHTVRGAIKRADWPYTVYFVDGAGMVARR